MGETTKIAWTDHTFNPWWGCTRVSPGCEHCYAAPWAQRFGVKWGKDYRFFHPEHWHEPERWNRKAERDGVRRRVFCGSMCDVFEKRAKLDEHRTQLWHLVEATPHLDWLLLTKRPENILDMVPEPWRSRFPDNVWPGTTAETQALYEERVMHLMGVSALVHFVSMEPLLEAITMKCVPPGCGDDTRAHMAPDQGGCPANFPEWIIAGGESGAEARPCDLAWLRSLVKQCEGNRLRVFVKQLGAVAVDSSMAEKDGTPGLLVGIRDKAGADPAEWESYLQVRESPEARP